LYPLPRGNFVADLEPNFCGGYPEVTTNRTTFPLSGGFFSIRTGHPHWTVGVLISTVPNPNSFDNFTINGVPQFVHPYAKQPDAGTFCVPLNIGAAGIAGVTDGANVTLEVVFEGGDGNLYQCADLTLSASITSPPSDVTCTNATATTTTAASTATHSSTGTLNSAHGLSAFTTMLFGLVGITVATL
jgi:hypothetical protein